MSQNPFDVFMEEQVTLNPKQPSQQSAPGLQNIPIGLPTKPNDDTLLFQKFDFNTKPNNTSLFDELPEENIPIRDDKPKANSAQSPQSPDDLDQPPLLEDLGINPLFIKQKILTVITLNKSDSVMNTPDLTGPILIAVALGVLLLLSGKLHFGDIMGLTVIGAVLLYFLLNFMSNEAIAPIYTMMSVLGYCQAPMLVLALFRIVISANQFLVVMAIAVSIWSAAAATIFFEAILQLHGKKWLIGYPVFLFYMTFVLIIVF